MAGMSAARELLQPIFTAHLFPELETKLIELMRELAPEDWEKQTLAPKRRIYSIRKSANSPRPGTATNLKILRSYLPRSLSR